MTGNHKKKLIKVAIVLKTTSFRLLEGVKVPFAKKAMPGYFNKPFSRESLPGANT